jgi:3-hydroxybutyryl-CoA dehydrogenase
MTDVPERLGVVGAGTIGAGVAQLGCAAGMRTRLYDPVPEALERSAERVRDGLGRERFFAALGLVTEWVEDAPGLVLGRIVCQLVNEAAFAVGEGVGSPEDVDAGLTLGLNHPHGPVEWGRVAGLEHVLAVIDGLWEERREERYRAAPALRRAVATGTGVG